MLITSRLSLVPLVLAAAALSIIQPSRAEQGTASPPSGKIGQGGSMEAPGSHTVKPGDPKYTNGDVSVVNEGERGDGNATVTPAPGDANSMSTVTTKNEFKGSISGIETGDMVHLGSNNSANVSTSGGNVSTGNMYMGTISNAGPPNMASTRIEPPAGEPFLLAPGSSVSYPAP
jgi:hypothetical protein